MADPADAKEYAEPRVELAGLHWPTYERQIQAESGWRHWRSPGVVLSSPTGSMGLGQLNSKFYPESDWRDPYTNLDKSIEIMRGYLARFGSYRLALAAYNWGPSNVSGYTDSAGRVHPAWDGSREWRCPHEGVVAQCRTAQRDHYLDVILGPGWPEPNTAPEVPTMTVYEEYPIPFAGTFATMPKGIILHGSRSGNASNPLDREVLGTARWAQQNPNGLGWNATIGEGKVALHLGPGMWSWNALQASRVYLGVEFAQPTAAHTITDQQVVAFCDWVKRYVLPVWPNLPMHFPSHAEVDREFNVNQGKTDVYQLGDSRMDELRAKIVATLTGSAPGPSPDFTVGSGLLEAMQARGDSPASDEIYVKAGERDAYSEAFGVSGARYVWLPAVGRVVRYDPAA